MLNRMEMIRIFCSAADCSNFRETATRLGVSPQAVTRAIKALEEELGEILFHRNTRQVHITAFGEAYAVRARQTLEGFDSLFRGHRADTESGFSGRVGITAPQAIGKRFLVGFLQPLLKRHPHLQLTLRLEDEITDAVDAQIDIGIRIGSLRDSRYVARTLAPVPLQVVATPELIATTGSPRTLAELQQRPLSVLIDRKSGRPWPWTFADGPSLLPANPALTCDDPEAELEVVLAGLAYGQLPAYLAQPHLESGRLQAVMAQQAPAPWQLFIYRPQQGPVSPRVRLVFDHLRACFSDPAQFPQG
ncbi:LysR family transcriptional regulator [Ectopseudomonas khazarica]|uniref:LysR family transcriptional regulator n=1 Tax=Ectopseudomonas khazarica TaxID=2502979 RepID=UPI002FE3A27E